jgi:hypothetical protein
MEFEISLQYLSTWRRKRESEREREQKTRHYIWEEGRKCFLL